VTVGPPDVSVVVPVYRNRESLRELAGRVHSALGGVWPYELLLVDDACPDGSAELIDELARGDDAVVPLHLPVNVGQQQAVLDGLAAARGTWCAVMDADLQDRPEELHTLLRRAFAGDVDVVFGGRRGLYESRWRALTGRVHRRVRAVLLPLPSDAGLFVVLSRAAVERVLALHGPSPSVVAMIGCTRLRFVSVPVVREARRYSPSSYSEVMRLRAALSSLTWGLHYRRRHIARLAARARLLREREVS
jgi:cellulose synthase/poly-beta-1,6-N-acetylglucosamine synthase-like glycosyltransferase